MSSSRRGRLTDCFRRTLTIRDSISKRSMTTPHVLGASQHQLPGRRGPRRRYAGLVLDWLARRLRQAAGDDVETVAAAAAKESRHVRTVADVRARLVVVAGGGDVRPWFHHLAPLPGLFRSLASVYPQLRCGLGSNAAAAAETERESPFSLNLIQFSNDARNLKGNLLNIRREGPNCVCVPAGTEGRCCVSKAFVEPRPSAAAQCAFDGVRGNSRGRQRFQRGHWKGHSEHTATHHW